MKKILLLCSTLCLTAKPYVGLELGVLKAKNIATIKGVDAKEGTFAPFSYSVDESYRHNSMLISVIAGYSFQKLGNLTSFIEADIRHISSKKSKNLDYDHTPDGNVLEAEAIRIQMGHGFGFMPGADLAITEKLSALIGVRFNITQYEVSAGHASPDGTIRSDNSSKKKTYIFGVEPTLGVKYNFTNNLSARITVGYNIGQRKRVINNYIGQQEMVNEGLSARVYVRPRGVALKAALIWNF